MDDYRPSEAFREISSFNARRLPETGIRRWDEDGVLLLPGIIPDSLIDAYVEERTKLIGGTDLWRPGWNDATPYQRVPSMKALALHRPMTEKISQLIGGKEPGLHLCLTGFQSTERAWHQDRVLNPETVGEHYIAAWIALEDTSELAGPFQYIPGSHRWPVFERGKVWSKMRQLGQNPDLPTWPSDSQQWVGEACEDEIAARKSHIQSYLGKRGDVLLWHASLLHRGSAPICKSTERRALICHYSSIEHRPDMKDLRREKNGSYWFAFDAVTPTR